MADKYVSKPEYVITGFFILRLLGFVYFIAFLSLANQLMPLIGKNGLLPAHDFLNSVGLHFNSRLEAFIKLPTIFWISDSDTFMIILAWSGVLVSLAVLLGFANAPMLFFLWFAYMSFVNVGQVWYSYGWEIQLLETGFLGIFLCPLIDPLPFSPPPNVVIWLLRWLTFRIHLGAGLIKLRGDSCWRDLSCLYYHYETQPIPNPLSRYLHFMPKIIHRLGVLWNHFIELAVPFFVFYPGILRYIAGILLISFQFILILSGNLSFLNWITIVPCIACFDDNFFRKLLPVWLIKKAEHYSIHKKVRTYQNILAWVFFIIVAWLSIPVVQNLLSAHQAMNTSFNRLSLVNTYGAFGSVGKERYELIIEGTVENSLTSDTKWKEYEFKAKPGNPNKTPPIIAPYQPRVDWQIWFAAMERPEQNPWLIHLIWKLLDNDKEALSLIANNPFPDKPPKFIRVEFYKYNFSPLGDKSGAVWVRSRVGAWLPPLSRSNHELEQYIKNNGWNS